MSAVVVAPSFRDCARRIGIPGEGPNPSKMRLSFRDRLRFVAFTVAVMTIVRVDEARARKHRQPDAVSLRTRRQRDPLFPVELAGKCVVSLVSGREICYPDLSILDYTCVKKDGDKKNTVPPPLIRHGQYKALITKFRPGEAPRDSPTNRTAKPFVVVQYQCNPGYEFLDEAEFLFCRDNEWIQTEPICVRSNLTETARQSPCQVDNGGCSHICHVLPGDIIRCACPPGMVLDSDGYGTCKDDDPCLIDNGGCSHLCDPPADPGGIPVCSCPENFILGSDKKTCFETKDWIVKPRDCPQVPLGHPTCENQCKHDDDCDGDKKCCSNGCAYVCLNPDLVERSVPDVSINPPGPLEVRPGGRVNLTCTGTGFPVPSLTWYQNERRMAQKESGLGRGDPSITASKTVFIKELFTTSTFRCEAVNDFGWKSVETKVIVTGPGSMPRNMRHRVRGTNITLTWKPPIFANGQIIGYRIYYTTGDARKSLAAWQSIELVNADRYVVSGLEPLTVYYFRIQAINDKGPGVLSLIFHIKTHEKEIPPSVIIDGFDGPYGRLELEPLASVNLTCKATAGWPKPALAWYREGGVPISEPTDKFSAVDLKLNNVMETTRFECLAANRAGSANGSVDVVVTGPGTPPQQIQYRVVDGANVDLSWGAPPIKNGPITGYTVFYTSDNPEVLPLDDWEVVVVEKAQSTVLRNLRPNTAYHVRIRAFNELGPGPASPAIPVDIGAPWALPDITIDPNLTEPVTPGSKLNITCRATGVPLPSLTWKKAGEEIVSAEPVYEPGVGVSKALIIDRIFETTRFTCEATNSAGTMVSDAEAVIRGPGSPPESLQATADRQTIAVTWEDPEYPNGDIQGYYLYFTESANDTRPLKQWTRIIIEDGQKFDWKLKNLNYHTPYTVRVSAFTRDADGIPLEGVVSEKVYATTSRDGEPPTIILSPSAPSLRIVPGGRINVTCTGVGVPDPHVKWYKNGKLMNVTINPDVLPGAVISSVELIIDRVYETSSFECKAVNALGTAAAGIRVDVLGPGTAPRDVYPIIYSNTIDIQWQEPALKNGLITRYEVSYTTDLNFNEKNWTSVLVTGAVNHHKLTGLLPNTNYTYMVRAFNEHGPGPWSARYTISTGSLETAPRVSVSPDGEIHRVRVGAKINLTCVAEGFPPPTVTWRMDSMAQDPRFVPESREVSLTFDNVREPFSIDCVGINPLGRDEKTIRIEVSGLGGAPMNPEGVAKGTTAQLRWDAPEIVEAEIKYFLLYFTNKPDLLDDQWQIASVPLRLPDEPAYYFWEIPHLRPYSEYKFKVRAYTEEGPGPFSSIVVLNTTERWFLHLEVHPDTTAEAPVSGGIDLLCKAKGIPPPLVTWKVNGRVIAAPRQYVSILKLDPINDITSVTCLAENDLDMLERTVQLVPSDRWQTSGVPTSWPDEDEGSTIVLDWTDLLVGAEEGTVYTIYYTTNPELPLDEWSNVQTKYPVAMRLPNITEDERYYMRVRIMHSEKEWSLVTAPTQVITPKFPTNVTIFVEDGVTKLAWDRVKVPDAEISSYIIYYTDDHHRPLKEWFSEEIAINYTNKAAVPNIHPDTPYYVKMVVQTDKTERLPTVIYNTHSPPFNRCEWANCEHKCIVLEDEFDAECSCEPGFDINEDGKTCSVPSTTLPPAEKWTVDPDLESDILAPVGGANTTKHSSGSADMESSGAEGLENVTFDRGILDSASSTNAYGILVGNNSVEHAVGRPTPPKPTIKDAETAVTENPENGSATSQFTEVPDSLTGTSENITAELLKQIQGHTGKNTVTKSASSKRPTGLTPGSVANVATYSGNATIAPVATPKQCSRIDVPLDLVIVLDASNSNLIIDHPLIKGALREMLDSYFLVDDDHAKVAFIQYSDLMAVEFALGQYGSKADMLKHILRVPHMVGSSRTENALAAALDLIQTGGRSDDVPKFVLLITDGLWIGDASLIAWQLQESAIHVLAVGVGARVTREELVSIVGGHEDRTVTYPNWASVKLELANDVVRKICDFLAATGATEEEAPEPEETSAAPYFIPSLRVVNITSNSAVLQWEVNEKWKAPGLVFEIRLIDRAKGAIRRFNISNTNTQYTLRLAPKKEYSVHLVAVGNTTGGTLLQSESVTFVTLAAPLKITKAPGKAKSTTGKPAVASGADSKLPGEVSITDVKLDEKIIWDVDDSTRNTSNWEFIIYHTKGIFLEPSLPPTTHQIVISNGLSRQHSLMNTSFSGINYTFWIRGRNELGDVNATARATMSTTKRPAATAPTVTKLTTKAKPKTSTLRPAVSVSAAPAIAPEIQEVDQLSATDLKISWTIDSLEKVPSDWDFVIYYASNSTLTRDQWDLRYATSSDANGFKLAGLKPEQEYTICIKARNTFGLGPSSNCVAVDLLPMPTAPSSKAAVTKAATTKPTRTTPTTEQETPEIFDLQVQNVTSNAASIYWNPEWQPADAKYAFIITDNKTGTTVRINIPLLDDNYVLSLKSGRTYTVYAISRSEQENITQTSEAITLTTPKASDNDVSGATEGILGLEYQPVVTEIDQLSNNSIRIKWIVESMDALPTGWHFVVQHSTKPSLPKDRWTDLNATAKEAEMGKVISGLTKGGDFQICVQMRNASAAGPISDCIPIRLTTIVQPKRRQKGTSRPKPTRRPATKPTVATVIVKTPETQTARSRVLDAESPATNATTVNETVVLASGKPGSKNGTTGIKVAKAPSTFPVEIEGITPFTVTVHWDRDNDFLPPGSLYIFTLVNNATGIPVKLRSSSAWDRYIFAVRPNTTYIFSAVATNNETGVTQESNIFVFKTPPGPQLTKPRPAGKVPSTEVADAALLDLQPTITEIEQNSDSAIRVWWSVPKPERLTTHWGFTIFYTLDPSIKNEQWHNVSAAVDDLTRGKGVDGLTPEQLYEICIQIHNGTVYSTPSCEPVYLIKFTQPGISPKLLSRTTQKPAPIAATVTTKRFVPLGAITLAEEEPVILKRPSPTRPGAESTPKPKTTKPTPKPTTARMKLTKATEPPKPTSKPKVITKKPTLPPLPTIPVRPKPVTKETTRITKTTPVPKMASGLTWPVTPHPTPWTSPSAWTTTTPAYQDFTLSIPPERTVVVPGCNCTCAIIVDDQRRRCYFDNDTAASEPAVSVRRMPNGQLVVRIGDEEYKAGEEKDCDDKSQVSPPGAAKEQDLQFALTTPVPSGHEADCPCLKPMRGNQCPPGYRLWQARCRDVNECEYKNGGCSHGCVNTPGGFYCACPPGLLRDPADPFECLSQEATFKRMARMMYIHMWHHVAQRPGVTVKPVGDFESAVEEAKAARPTVAPGQGYARAIIGNGTDTFSLEWQWSEFLKNWKLRR